MEVHYMAGSLLCLWCDVHRNTCHSRLIYKTRLSWLNWNIFCWKSDCLSSSMQLKLG